MKKKLFTAGLVFVLLAVSGNIQAKDVIYEKNRIKGGNTLENWKSTGKWEGIEGYDGYRPSWEFKAPAQEVELFRFKARGSVGRIKTATCGIEATAFYKLALALNKDSLKQIFDPKKYKGLAFVAGLYILGTYYPTLKEAMVGAEMIANTIAKLRNLNCQSAMKMMTDYFKSSSKLVTACVLNRIDSDIDPWKASSEEIEKAMSRVGEAKLRSAYNYCINNANIFDALNQTSEVKTWLKEKVNGLRRWVSCGLSDRAGLKDLKSKMVLSKRHALRNDVSTMAKIALLAMTPEWIMDEKTKQFYLKPTVLDDGRELNIFTITELIKEGVDEDFKELEELAKEGDLTGFEQYVKNMNARYYLNDKGLMKYFYLYYYLVKKTEERKQAKDPDYYKFEALKENYVRSFKKFYYHLKQKQLRVELEKQRHLLLQKAQFARMAISDGLDPCATENSSNSK